MSLFGYTTERSLPYSQNTFTFMAIKINSDVNFTYF